MSSSTDRYSTVAAAFHWVLAILLIVQIYVGWTFGDMERGPARGEWFNWHKTLGFLILFLSIGRLGWRVANPPAPLPQGMKPWEKALARFNHTAFYVILIGLPLTGWAYISTGSGALESSTTPLVFGIEFPFLPGVPRAGHDAFEEAHILLVYLTYALLALHIAAVLKHMLIDSGRVPLRMPPFKGAR